MNIGAFLKGKKTFIASALAVAATGLGMYTGQITIPAGVSAILIATGLATNRQGSKNDAAAAAATVVTSIAPMVAAAIPRAAGATAIAQEVIAQLDARPAPQG